MVDSIDQKILEHLRKYPRSSSKQLAEAIGVNRTTISRHIQYLKKEKEVVFDLEGGYPVWLIPAIEDIQMFISLCKAHSEKIYNFLENEKYNPRLYVERESEQDVVFSFLNDPSNDVLYISGDAGTGKTNLLCWLYRSLTNDYPTFFMVSSNIIPEREDSLITYIEKSLSEAISFNDELGKGLSDFRFKYLSFNRDNHSEQPFIILIDAINEAQEPAKFRSCLNKLFYLTETLHVKFIITCRSEEIDYFMNYDVFSQSVKFSRSGRFNLSSDIGYQKKESIQLNEFTFQEFNKAWKKYSKVYSIRGTPNNDVLRFCRNPLLLRLFSEAYQDSNVSEITLAGDYDVFLKYWDRKVMWSVREFGLPIDEFLIQLARLSLENMTVDISKDQVLREINIRQVDKILKRLTDEGVIIFISYCPETGSNLITFTFERFREFLFALLEIRRYNLEYCTKSKALQTVRSLFRQYYQLIHNIESEYYEFESGVTTEYLMEYRMRRGALVFILLFLDERFPGFISRDIPRKYWELVPDRNVYFMLLPRLKTCSVPFLKKITTQFGCLDKYRLITVSATRFPNQAEKLIKKMAMDCEIKYRDREDPVYYDTYESDDSDYSFNLVKKPDSKHKSISKTDESDKEIIDIESPIPKEVEYIPQRESDLPEGELADADGLIDPLIRKFVGCGHMTCKERIGEAFGKLSITKPDVQDWLDEQVGEDPINLIWYVIKISSLKDYSAIDLEGAISRILTNHKYIATKLMTRGFKPDYTHVTKFTMEEICKRYPSDSRKLLQKFEKNSNVGSIAGNMRRCYFPSDFYSL